MEVETVVPMVVAVVTLEEETVVPKVVAEVAVEEETVVPKVVAEVAVEVETVVPKVVAEVALEEETAVQRVVAAVAVLRADGREEDILVAGGAGLGLMRLGLFRAASLGTEQDLMPSPPVWPLRHQGPPAVWIAPVWPVRRAQSQEVVQRHALLGDPPPLPLPSWDDMAAQFGPRAAHHYETRLPHPHDPGDLAIIRELCHDRWPYVVRPVLRGTSPTGPARAVVALDSACLFVAQSLQVPIDLPGPSRVVGVSPIMVLASFLHAFRGPTAIDLAASDDPSALQLALRRVTASLQPGPGLLELQGYRPVYERLLDHLVDVILWRTYDPAQPILCNYGGLRAAEVVTLELDAVVDLAESMGVRDLMAASVMRARGPVPGELEREMHVDASATSPRAGVSAAEAPTGSTVSWGDGYEGTVLDLDLLETEGEGDGSSTGHSDSADGETATLVDAAEGRAGLGPVATWLLDHRALVAPPPLGGYPRYLYMMVLSRLQDVETVPSSWLRPPHPPNPPGYPGQQRLARPFLRVFRKSSLRDLLWTCRSSHLSRAVEAFVAHVAPQGGSLTSLLGWRDDGDGGDGPGPDGPSSGPPPRGDGPDRGRGGAAEAIFYQNQNCHF